MDGLDSRHTCVAIIAAPLITPPFTSPALTGQAMPPLTTLLSTIHRAVWDKTLSQRRDDMHVKLKHVFERCEWTRGKMDRRWGRMRRARSIFAKGGGLDVLLRYPLSAPELPWMGESASSFTPSPHNCDKSEYWGWALELPFYYVRLLFSEQRKVRLWSHIFRIIILIISHLKLKQNIQTSFPSVLLLLSLLHEHSTHPQIDIASTRLFGWWPEHCSRKKCKYHRHI